MARLGWDMFRLLAGAVAALFVAQAAVAMEAEPGGRRTVRAPVEGAAPSASDPCAGVIGTGNSPQTYRKYLACQASRQALAKSVSSDCAALTSAGSSRETYRKYAACQAQRYGLPPIVAHSVMEIESGFNRGARGGDGEVGLMQVMPRTARMLGFRGTLDDLETPETNIEIGVRYLAQAYRLAQGDLCTTVMKYRAGHGESRFSVLSVRYCERARFIHAREGAPVVGVVPVATFGFGAGGGFGSFLGGSAKGRGVCVRRLFVPGPRYRSCVAWRAVSPTHQAEAAAPKQPG